MTSGIPYVFFQVQDFQKKRKVVFYGLFLQIPLLQDWLSGQGPPFQIGKDWDSGIAIPAPMVNSCSPNTKMDHQKPVVNRVK